MKVICVRIIVLTLIFRLFCPSLALAAGDIRAGNGKMGKDIIPEISNPLIKEGALKPVLAVSPGEIDLGDAAPGDVANGLFVLKNIGAGSLLWFTGGPEGWELPEKQELTGVLATESAYLHVSVRPLKNAIPENAEKAGQKSYAIQLTIAEGGKVLLFRKEMPAGTYRESININSPEETRTVLLNFKIIDGKSKPQLNVEPQRIDFGVLGAGKQAARQIKISNKSKETVQWRAIIPKPGDEKTIMPPRRYLSFVNDEIKGGAAYLSPSHLKDSLEIVGKWVEQEGYPSAHGINNYIRYRFSGSGIALHLRHGPDMGKLALYLDEQLVHVYDGNAPERGREELPVADGLPDGQHVLAIANGDGRVIVEGVAVYGKELMRGNQGWITVIPDSGTTTRETDYLNVRIDAQQLNPGLYGGAIVIASNGGNVIVETSVEIRAEHVPKFLDVYRYVRNHNYLFTTNPQAEAGRLQSGGYKKEGIAFRLLPPGTPGTTEFYRWYSTKKDDHFYSYDLQGGGRSLQGYTFEGTIGNIGTSRLTNTRELYRWYNQKTGSHFFTTDQKGEGMAGKGYKFDGIAGYVK